MGCRCLICILPSGMELVLEFTNSTTVLVREFTESTIKRFNIRREIRQVQRVYSQSSTVMRSIECIHPGLDLQSSQP